MRKVLKRSLLMTMCVLAASWDVGRAATAATYPPAPDYARADAWACRPGSEQQCTHDLDAVAVAGDGSRELRSFVAVDDPPIDCFYVYPTVSTAPQDFADIAAEPAVMNAVRLQAGRLATRCRLYAPLYRQATLLHLHERRAESWDGPYEDVAHAWEWYLQHDNRGRGVVLIGHSQGARWLQRLIAERIDGSPQRELMVAAFLVGGPGLLVPKGEVVGGTFKHIPVCQREAQTGCAYAWSTYRADATALRAFGRDKDGLYAACTNPAAPGGAGELDSFLGTRFFPAVDSRPAVELIGQMRAQCVSDSQGSVLQITVQPGANENNISAALDAATLKRPLFDWGLHVLDVSLAQGNVLHLIDAEAAAWQPAKH